MNENSIIEDIAKLEHEQWTHWTQYFIDTLLEDGLINNADLTSNENLFRWTRQIDTPYEELTEKEKESDRRWAKKVFQQIFWDNRLRSRMFGSKAIKSVDNSSKLVLMSHTLGSIGQIVKDETTLDMGKFTEYAKINEIERIYNGYVSAIKDLTDQS